MDKRKPFFLIVVDDFGWGQIPGATVLIIIKFICFLLDFHNLNSISDNILLSLIVLCWDLNYEECLHDFLNYLKTPVTIFWGLNQDIDNYKKIR